MSSTPPRPRTGPRRRTLLASAAGAASALLAACSADSSPGRAAAVRTPTADERALTRAVTDSAELASVYDAVLAAHPGLAARLTPLRDAVLRHADACGERAGTAASPSPSPSPSPPRSAAGKPSGAASGPPSSPTPSVPAVPADEKGALGSLADAEQELSTRRTRDLARLGGEAARLLASVAAAGAVHVYLLRNG
ncbi:hypothetical protein [Streptomyces abyssomicinicus]|uniref:hypothetical protein n=1 Tax=Streptomyces abyssomicinicus TaxID=574929 RepID=UPI00124F9295|nr:hypothetical protein [Streptomyces abyssomicinicus]